MFFAITALGVSAVQILIGVAIGMSLRKNRQRQTAGGEGTHAGRLRELPVAKEADQPPRQAEVRSANANDETQRRSALSSQAAQAGVPPMRDEAGESGDEREGDTPGPASWQNSLRAAPADLPSGSDRRISSRRLFDYRQNVAPYHGGVLPGKASFREVDCQDISSTGFSFLSSQLPDFDSIVVALGVAPHLVYVQAHIVNRFQVADGPAPLYRIGCRFVGPVA